MTPKGKNFRKVGVIFSNFNLKTEPVEFGVTRYGLRTLLAEIDEEGAADLSTRVHRAQDEAPSIGALRAIHIPVGYWDDQDSDTLKPSREDPTSMAHPEISVLKNQILVAEMGNGEEIPVKCIDCVTSFLLKVSDARNNSREDDVETQVSIAC